ncbi:hypothetical protein PYCCODRAFT_946332 [Trametes coccinea BRFM310]|uniref:Uncharacterized protein n=1 Tax=Trametes coccinea (strain BRFM310) TaxID=1353009 RepID=A0A1Y2IZH5_TRAC3|nr:hypothetical protein PYCCODRAFT_946332 [Trametes coccinea BRFM310]
MAINRPHSPGGTKPSAPPASISGPSPSHKVAGARRTARKRKNSTSTDPQMAHPQRRTRRRVQVSSEPPTAAAIVGVGPAPSLTPMSEAEAPALAAPSSVVDTTTSTSVTSATVRSSSVQTIAHTTTAAAPPATTAPENTSPVMERPAVDSSIVPVPRPLVDLSASVINAYKSVRRAGQRRGNQADSSAKDVWYFMRPLDSAEPPLAAVQQDHGPALTCKPSSQFVGCKACSSS